MPPIGKALEIPRKSVSLDPVETEHYGGSAIHVPDVEYFEVAFS
jgi:hypothetical protein